MSKRWQSPEGFFHQPWVNFSSPQVVKLPFFPCNDWRFMQALFHFPEFCLDSPELKWRGRVNKSWGILLCPFHWKTVLSKDGWRGNPFTFCWLVSLRRHGPRDASADVRDFCIQTFRALGFPRRLRNVHVVSERWSGSRGSCFPKQIVIRSNTEDTRSTYELHMSENLQPAWRETLRRILFLAQSLPCF